jgi:hypothetical protein
MLCNLVYFLKYLTVISFVTSECMFVKLYHFCAMQNIMIKRVLNLNFIKWVCSCGQIHDLFLTQQKKWRIVSQWIVILFVCEDSNINFQSDGTEDTRATFVSVCLSVCLYTYSTLQHLILVTFDINSFW